MDVILFAAKLFHSAARRGRACVEYVTGHVEHMPCQHLPAILSHQNHMVAKGINAVVC